MKIQLIRLEEHDDIISARDKLGWGQTGRVVLVWPERGSRIADRRQQASPERRASVIPLTRRIDLVLLQRRALELGVQLAFVSRNPLVRTHAQSLGIPIFKTPREAQNLRWRRSRRRRFPWQNTKIEAQRASFRQQINQSPPHHSLAVPSHLPLLARALVFTLGMLSVIALSAALLPGAQITIKPASQAQTITLTVSANSDFNTISLAGEVPTYRINTIVEGQASITSTATILVPDHYATGYVRFSNLTTETITVPLGTVVTQPYTDTIRFTTTQAGIVPAGTGKSTYITVKAISPGKAGNLPGGSLQVIEGSLNYRLAATNTAPTRDGTDRSAPSPSPEDRIRLYNQLLLSLRQIALSDLDAQLASGDLLLSSTLGQDDIILKTYDPDNAMPSSQLHLTLRVQYHAQKISGADLHQLATMLLDAGLPAGYTPLPDTLVLNNLSKPQIDKDKIARWQMTVSRHLQAKLSKEEAVNLALGLPPAQAAKRLSESMPLAAPPSIRIDPGWWPRLPFIPLRIQVVAAGIQE